MRISDSSSRILHEARQTRARQTPQCRNVHGADRHDGRVGFWMDLIEGELWRPLVRGRLTRGRSGLHRTRDSAAPWRRYTWRVSIHRDVKAQNVMRANNGGRIILMDFGAGEFMDRASATAN